MFHDFPADPGTSASSAPRSFSYWPSTRNPPAVDPGYSYLRSVTQSGLSAAGRRVGTRAQPPVEFAYSGGDDRRRRARTSTRQHSTDLPVGVAATRIEWIDLVRRGAPRRPERAGRRPGSTKPNLGAGPAGPRFGPAQPLATLPTTAALAPGRQRLLDVQGDGALDLVDFDAPLGGFQPRDAPDGWRPFTPFPALPDIDWRDPSLRFVDLTGDSLADALVTSDDGFTWYASQGEAGYAPATVTAAPQDELSGPQVVFADAVSVHLADMSGDGLADLVRVPTARR